MASAMETEIHTARKNWFSLVDTGELSKFHYLFEIVRAQFKIDPLPTGQFKTTVDVIRLY